ncbi:MAG: hypothetical protein EXR27_23220 [Betaproteobacteria bacterium]|nr:hypothetical protein [Betaproteobacteria bacterium]
MAPAARKRFGNDKRWAAACGLTAETLSRLRKRKSCDLQTLNALAAAAGYEWVMAPATVQREGAFFGRAQEEDLVELCVSGNADAAVWQQHGSGFFMGGLAMLLASVRGFDRRRYIELAETLHPGVSQPEVFALWLQRSPLRPARFVPMLRHWRSDAA